MNIFIKKLLKKKELCERLNESFNDNRVFERISVLLNYILENLNNSFEDLITILFDFCIKIQNISATKLSVFSNEFFKKLIQKIDRKTSNVSTELNNKLYGFFCELLTIDIFGSTDSFLILEQSLTYLIESVLNNEHKDMEIFSIIHKIIKIYQMKDVS